MVIKIRPLKIKRASRPPVDLWRPHSGVATHRLGTNALGIEISSIAMLQQVAEMSYLKHLVII